MGHSSLMDDLAWSGHNERINSLEECKKHFYEILNDPKVTSQKFKKSIKRGIRYYDWLIKICHKFKDQPAVTMEFIKLQAPRKRHT